ncbi:MAG: T9SS type A sorting domain-containing protein [Bacteroidales bacterium]|nr:T9SS type A sorting domain-containing protein [Bacteroidales bacterium]
MKKFTILALTLGMAFGLFAQQTLPKLDTDRMIIPVKQNTVKTHSGVKSDKTTITNVEIIETDSTGLTANYVITPAEGVKEYGVVIWTNGTLESYFQQGISIGTLAWSLHEQYYRYNMEFFHVTDGTPIKMSATRLYGNVSYEIDVITIAGTDTSYVQYTDLNTPDYQTYFTGVSDVEVIYNSITDNGANITFAPNDQTFEYYVFINTTKYFSSFGLEDASLVYKFYQRYATRFSTVSGEYTFTLGGDESESQLDECTGYAIAIVPINGNREVGNLVFSKFKTEGDCTGKTDGNTVGLSEIDDGMINVYPNPATEVMEVSALSAINGIEVVNPLGQVVYSDVNTSDTYKIPVNTMAKGTYFLKIRTSDKVLSKKIVVK